MERVGCFWERSRIYLLTTLKSFTLSLRRRILILNIPFALDLKMIQIVLLLALLLTSKLYGREAAFRLLFWICVASVVAITLHFFFPSILTLDGVFVEEESANTFLIFFSLSVATFGMSVFGLDMYDQWREGQSKDNPEVTIEG